MLGPQPRHGVDRGVGSGDRELLPGQGSHSTRLPAARFLLIEGAGLYRHTRETEPRAGSVVHQLYGRRCARRDAPGILMALGTAPQLPGSADPVLTGR